MEAGREWYPAAYRECKRIAAGARMPVENTAAIVAVLSQQLSWKRNLPVAETIIRTGTRPAGVLGAGAAKAFRIRAGEDPAAIVRGNKVIAFWRNLMLDTEAVTVDRHALAAALNRVTTEAERKALQSPRLYGEISAAYVRAAARHGMTAPEFQAVIWTTWKRIARERRGR